MSASLSLAAARARAQHGLITLEQAVDTAGLSTRQVQHLVEEGLWERLCRGLYRVAGSARTYEQRVLAACLAAGPTAVASHGSAARLLDLGRPHFQQAPVELTVARGTSAVAARSLGAIVHETRQVTAVDRGRLGAIPVTAPARLIVDLLGRVRADALYGVADDALWRLTTSTRVWRTWKRVGRGQHRATIDAVLLPWAPGPRPGSPKEMSLSRVLQLHGLDRPARQHPVADPLAGGLRYLDLAYVAERVAPEYDGRRNHGPRDWTHDTQREEWLARAGWIRIPAGRLDLVEPGATDYCEVVRAALRLRRESA